MTIVRSVECQAVLARFGLAGCAMVIIGADKLQQPPTWGVTITCHSGRSEFLDIAQAANLSVELRRIREDRLAERVTSAVETAKKRMRPKA